MKIKYLKDLFGHKAQGDFIQVQRVLILVAVFLTLIILAQGYKINQNQTWCFIFWVILMIGIFFVHGKFKIIFRNRDMAEAKIIDLNKQMIRQIQELHTEKNKSELTEIERVKLQDRLNQAQKMEAIGTLAGGIAHDFNNILSIIFGYTELTIALAPKDSEQEKNLSHVVAAAKRAKLLINQILCFSRQHKAEFMPLQLSTCIKEILKMMRSSLPTTIKIVQEIDNEQNYVLADATQIHQVVTNLCTNAFHAMEQLGGALTVVLKKVVISEDQVLKNEDAKPGAYMQLSISDTGVGMDSRVKERIFDPYFTTRGAGKGTGMGLAIVHGIVATYGGFVTVDSELGKGSTFNVFIPLWCGEEVKCQKVDELIILGSEKILLVDDEPQIADVCAMGLRLLGYDVISTTSSLEALKIFEDSPDSFDLILTDQTMPELTGAQLADKIINIRPDIPIIMCTGYSSIMSPEVARGLGVKEFILKPVKMSDLSIIIKKVLEDEKNK
ncbi:response regulator [Candidatus Parcubacteria bacterium]|nr:response regulator [Patescibacteria group bacterium]MBU4309104.1 response regulator [Patescibacteria group bacterium]MBU4431950.1 response regulator [Patescibacteria group bacterium]MBU4577465.1 response regulator [Patescibacteria group bacterium]MCG2697153.1 response regulator [Candidatus Parcubacteria bacterium]